MNKVAIHVSAHLSAYADQEEARQAFVGDSRLRECDGSAQCKNASLGIDACARIEVPYVVKINADSPTTAFLIITS